MTDSAANESSSVPVNPGLGDGTRAVRAGLPEPVKYAADPPRSGVRRALPPAGRPHRPVHLRPGRRTRPGRCWSAPSASWRRRSGTASRRSSSPPGWPPSRRCSSPSCAPGTPSSCPTTATRRCPWCGRSWRRTASRCAPRRPAATPSSTCSTARGCCGSRPRPTPASTCATSDGSPRRRTRVAVLVAVDNTLATPLGQRPLELGADFSVASGTKGSPGTVTSCSATSPAGRLRDGRRTTVAQDRRGDSRAHGGLARAPVARHTPPACRPAGRHRAGSRRGSARAARGDRAALSGAAGRPLVQDRFAADAALRVCGVLRAARRARVPTVSWTRCGSSTTRRASVGCGPPPNGAAGGAGTPCRRASSASRSAPRTRRTWWRTCCARWRSRTD